MEWLPLWATVCNNIPNTVEQQCPTWPKCLVTCSINAYHYNMSTMLFITIPFQPLHTSLFLKKTVHVTLKKGGCPTKCALNDLKSDLVLYDLVLFDLAHCDPHVLDLAGAFLHQNWSGQRQNWMKAINMCTKARDFALALAILESCIKPVIFTNAWHDNLGKATHTTDSVAVASSLFHFVSIQS